MAVAPIPEEYAWKNYEFLRCLCLIQSRSADASYLRMQASSAFRDGEPEISARLRYAATAVNDGAWKRAERHMLDPMMVVCK